MTFKMFKTAFVPNLVEGWQHYLEHLTRMVDFAEITPPSSTITPLWMDDRQQHHLRSSCWYTDLAMCHDQQLCPQEEAKKCMDVKEANKQFKQTQESFDTMPVVDALDI